MKDRLQTYSQSSVEQGCVRIHMASRYPCDHE